MKRNLELTAVLLLLGLVLAPALYHTPPVSGQAGILPPALVPNDQLHDNGATLNAMVAAGIKRPVEAGGGVYYATTPAALGKRDGVELDFQGIVPWSRVGRPMASSAVVWLYSGNAKDANGALLPAIHAQGCNTIFSGLNLWRSFYGDISEQDGTTGLLLTDPATRPHLVNNGFAGWDTAIRIGKSNHVECASLENVTFIACNTCIRNEEPQAVGHHFENIVLSSAVERFYHAPKVYPGRVGGGLSVECNTMSVMSPALIWDLETTSGNGYGITQTNLKIDANARGWRLIEQDAGNLDLYVRGGIGLQADPAIDAIDVPDGANVDVRLAWRGRYWPEDFEVENGEWVVRAE